MKNNHILTIKQYYKGSSWFSTNNILEYSIRNFETHHWFPGNICKSYVKIFRTKFDKYINEFSYIYIYIYIYIY